ncbi:hypothetical protein H5410_023450 [Solanum commersonii]|uniref:Uncharacterized protein n=1 Tax=Solanum commersonii TaxID=4109 RepID=A0A9J5ZGX4_SOLCO|nr:hypothetical protein H5410_023450 [Solanum commersonii]
MQPVLRLGYGMISKPLTSLLKKGIFEWSDAATIIAFETLKDAIHGGGRCYGTGAIRLQD